MKKKRFLLLMIMFITNFLIVTNVSAAVGEWIGDYCDSCGNYGTAGKCDQVKYTNVGLFRVTFYLNGEKIGSSVNVSSNETYKNLAKNAKWHWGDGKTDIVSYASGQTLGTPVSGGLDTIVINGISTGNVQTKLSPSKNSKNVQKILTEAGITKFKFKNGKIYYTPDDGVCEEDYQIQMVVESMQVINWLCTTDGLDNHRWIGTPYELNNGLLQQGYNSHAGGNGYMSGSIVDKTLLSSLRIDKNVKIGNVTFTSVDDCLKIHIRGYKPTEGYGFNVYDLTGEIKIDCEPECCVPCNTSNPNLITAINSGKFVCDPYNCEGEDEIATGIDSNGNLVCEPYTPDDCCDPSKENCCIIGTQLCDGSVVDEQYYNLYCSQDNGCKYPIKLPEAQTGVCTTDNSDNKSKFKDGNFSDIIYDYKNLFYQGEIKIYQPENTSTYCETYCQEQIIIKLPKNYPYANAGRYFTWTISDKDDSLIKETVEKNCATDIKLDKWMNDYRTKITEIDAALSKWNEEGIYLDISGENLAKRRTDLNTELRKCIASAKNSTEKILKGMNEEDRKKIENDALKEVEDTGDDKETGIEKRIKEDNNNKTAELNGLYSGFSDISKNELEEKCGNQCTVKTLFGDYYIITPNGLPKDKDSEEYKNLIESEKEKIKNEAIGASIAAEIQSRVNACISQFDGGYVQTLSNAKGDILKEHRNNSGDIEKYTFEGNNPENATLNSLISDLKKCQYNYDENEDTEKSNVKNTLLNLKFLYSTYLSTSEYSNSDIDVTTTNSPITSSKGCIQITENEECNPNLIFESSSCRTGTVIVNDKTMYLISSIPGLLNSNKSYNYENLSNYWNSYFFAKSRFENEYKLKNNINACVCKDGTIINANDDGSCECPDMSSKTEIIADISNQYSCYFEWKTTKYYTTISSGNLSVEYMTPTGLYPLSLDYSNIGTNGHFSQLMKDGVLKNVSHCEDGTCHYSDEDGKCYFIVDNEVIIDGGFIEDSICPEGICEPDDKCTGGDCSNFCEVGKCSNDSSVGGMEIIYRQIDLNNPFPDREPGKNWQGNEEIITNNRDVDGNKLYSSNLEPIYSITMTPSTIKEIRKVNNALNYDYSSISTMLFDDNKITGGVSYVLRGNLKDIAEKTGGSFTINLNDANTSGRFDDIINNTKVDNSGNLATCREKASEVLK